MYTAVDYFVLAHAAMMITVAEVVCTPLVIDEVEQRRRLVKVGNEAAVLHLRSPRGRLRRAEASNESTNH